MMLHDSGNNSGIEHHLFGLRATNKDDPHIIT